MRPNDEKSDVTVDSQEFIEAGKQRELSLIGEFWVFIKENKAWWMIPILLVLAALGVLTMLGSTGAAPFIYTLF